MVEIKGAIVELLSVQLTQRERFSEYFHRADPDCRKYLDVLISAYNYVRQVSLLHPNFHKPSAGIVERQQVLKKSK